MTYGKSIALNENEFSGNALAETNPAVRSEAEVQFVEKLRAGDAQAFDQLVTRYSGDIYGFLFRTIKDPEEAKDITQETFIRAFKAMPKFRGEASVKTWLFRIAINQSRNRFRWWKVRKRDKTLSLDHTVGASERQLGDTIASESLNPEDEAIRKERAMALHTAIAGLPEHYREALVLCDIQGFAYEEIASILEINLGTVKSRISRGRDELRKTLKDI